MKGLRVKFLLPHLARGARRARDTPRPCRPRRWRTARRRRRDECRGRARREDSSVICPISRRAASQTALRASGVGARGSAPSQPRVAGLSTRVARRIGVIPIAAQLVASFPPVFSSRDPARMRSRRDNRRRPSTFRSRDRLFRSGAALAMTSGDPGRHAHRRGPDLPPSPARSQGPHSVEVADRSATADCSSTVAGRSATAD